MNEKPKRQKTGGRKAGTPNKVTLAVKEVAGEYTESAINTLAGIMKDSEQPAAARVSAARELLDRAHGKPTQPVETTVSVGQMDLAAINAELEQAAKVREARRAQLESEGRIGRFQTP